MAMSRHYSFKTGSIPGNPISTKFAFVFGSSREEQREVENILCLLFIWTWNSKPTMQVHFSINFVNSLFLASLCFTDSLGLCKTAAADEKSFIGTMLGIA